MFIFIQSSGDIIFLSCSLLWNRFLTENEWLYVLGIYIFYCNHQMNRLYNGVDPDRVKVTARSTV